MHVCVTIVTIVTIVPVVPIMISHLFTTATPQLVAAAAAAAAAAVYVVVFFCYFFFRTFQTDFFAWTLGLFFCDLRNSAAHPLPCTYRLGHLLQCYGCQQ